MKLFLLGPNHQFYCNSMALRALLFSSQALGRQPSAITPLKRMIMREADPKVSVVPLLENWVQQGNEIKYSQIRKLIRDLFWGAHRFNPALQISQWMGDKGGYQLSAADYADQLELTSIVGGIRQVEAVWETIPYNLRGPKVHYALLRSYARLGCLERGENTMLRIRWLGFLRNASDYNNMLSFYADIDYYTSHMDAIAEEMRTKGINFNMTTYNILLKASVYAMEDLFMEMEDDPLVKIDWYQYLLAAEIYWDEWYYEDKPNVLKMLKKSEKSMEMEGNLNRFAFRLLTLHAAVGNKADVYRLWSLYKPNKRFYNIPYFFMIRSLIKMCDMDGAERIWKEWFSEKEEMDFRIPKAMIKAYAWEGKWEKAEAIVLRMTESGIEPDADTLDALAFAFAYEQKQMEKAVETLMKAISVSMPAWKPIFYTVIDCFEYLKLQGDGVAKEELHKMLKEHCGLSTRVCDHLKKCISIDKGTIAGEMNRRQR